MNTTIIVENAARAVIDKNEADHDGALQMNAEYAPPSRQSIDSGDRAMSHLPVTRLVKSVMVAAALMMSVPSVSFATVSFNEGQIVGKSGDTYSVKQPGGSVWSGVERSQLTEQQIKSYEMAQEAQAARNQAIPLTSLTSSYTTKAVVQPQTPPTMTQAEKEAVHAAQISKSSAVTTDKKIAKLRGAALTKDNQQRTSNQAVALADARQLSNDKAIQPSKEYGDAMTKANQLRTEPQAIAKANAQQADANHQAAANAQGDALTSANQIRTQQQVQAGAQAMMASLTASKMASANSTINVSAGSLGDTPVKTTSGETVLASSLPGDTQVSKPYNSALFGSVTRASNGGGNSNSGEGSHGGTGNGNENAQASHSAGGFSTDHDHIGGGHTGGGFHY